MLPRIGRRRREILPSQIHIHIYFLEDIESHPFPHAVSPFFSLLLRLVRTLFSTFFFPLQVCGISSYIYIFPRITTVSYRLSDSRNSPSSLKEGRLGLSQSVKLFALPQPPAGEKHKIKLPLPDEPFILSFITRPFLLFVLFFITPFLKICQKILRNFSLNIYYITITLKKLHFLS